MAHQVNPITGVNSRGFHVQPYDLAAEKRATAQRLRRALPAGYTLVSFRYKPFGVPRDSVVELKVDTPGGLETVEVRAPIDFAARPWGGRVPEVLVAFLKQRYP